MAGEEKKAGVEGAGDEKKFRAKMLQWRHLPGRKEDRLIHNMNPKLLPGGSIYCWSTYCWSTCHTVATLFQSNSQETQTPLATLKKHQRGPWPYKGWTLDRVPKAYRDARLSWGMKWNKLAKLRRCVSQVSFWSKKFGPRKLLPRTNRQVQTWQH